MIDNPLIEIKNHHDAIFWWVIIIISVIFGIFAFNNEARLNIQRIVLADIKDGYELISFSKIEKYYVVKVYLYENGKKTKLINYFNNEQSALNYINSLNISESKEDTSEPSSKLKTFIINLTNRVPEYKDGNWQLAHDKSPHEATHGINALSRDRFPERKGTGIHIGFQSDENALLVWMDEPKGNIDEFIEKNLIPQSCRPRVLNKIHGANKQTIKDFLLRQGYRIFREVEGGFFYIDPKLGLTEVKVFTVISYLFDEWSAYIQGGKARLNDLKEGKRVGSDGVELIHANISEGPALFLVLGGSVALYLKEKDPSYFKSDNFRGILKLLYEQTMALINESLSVTRSGSENTANLLNLLRNDKAYLNIRSILKEMYGSEWTNKVLGF